MMNRGSFFKTLFGGIAVAVLGPNVLKALPAAPVVAPIAVASTYDPMLISLVRRSVPNLAAYDICSVLPMTGPTGLIFSMDYRYGEPKRLHRSPTTKRKRR